MKATLISIFLLFACIAGAQTQDVLVIYFDFDKYSLTEKAKMQIDSFLSVQQARDAYITKVELSGHCDFIGPDGYNDILSTKRVNEVKELILTYDFAKRNIITTIAYGEKKPLNENRTVEERQLNRRVEILLTTAIADVIRDEAAVPVSPVEGPVVKLKDKIADSTTTAGTNIVLRSINFYGGMHRLMPESRPMLQELLDAMKTYPNLVIEIQGHICCESRPNDGMDMETGVYNLSAARAKAVYDHLIANGIQASRISYRGFGHSQPIYPYPERSEEERMANRRVEIKIISK